MLKVSTIALSLFLILELAWSIFFPEWKFASYDLRIAEIIAIPISMALLLICLIALRSEQPLVVLAIGPLLLLIAGIFVYMSLHPLDSHSEPKEIAVLVNKPNNHKIVVREYLNYKHNRMDYDTLLIEQKGIFRKIIK